VVGPQAKREAISFLIEHKNFKPHRAYKLVGLRSSTYYYKSYSKRDDVKLKAKLIEIAQRRIRWGCPRIYEIARREGFNDNYKRVERLYGELGLSLRKRAKKKLRGHLRLVLPEPQRPNDIWSMDFVSETLFDQRRFRCFTVVDDFTRENIVIYPDRSIRSEKIVSIFEKLKRTRGLPKMIVCDNGPEFISQNLDIWAYQNKVDLKFIQPGKPVQNAYIESFNGKFRDECLNQHWFLNLEDARVEIEKWRKDYNENRPHSSLRMKTPSEFAKEYEVELTS
jgi:putative transposase